VKDIIPLRRVERGDVSDQALLSACALGDNLALQELFQRHAERVYRVLVRMQGIQHRDLDDIVQMTFIEVKRSAKQFDARAAVGTWIIGIALNVSRQHARSERRRRVAMSAVADLPPANDGEDPHHQVAHRQDLVRLQRGLDALPSKLRAVFTLIDLEGMRGAEVARALDIPEGTVWSRLHEARERLRQAVDEGGRR